MNAQIAPLFEGVPPRLYVGTERVGAYLTEGADQAGTSDDPFASEDSVTSAELGPSALIQPQRPAVKHSPVAPLVRMRLALALSQSMPNAIFRLGVIL